MEEGRSALRALALLQLAFAALAIASVIVDCLGLKRVDQHPGNPGLKAALRTALEFVTLGFGPVVRSRWPAWATVSLVLLVSTGLLVVAIGVKRPQERLRALGLLFFLGALVSLALAVGWGRSGFGHKPGLTSRYTTLAVPLVIAIYFAWELYGGRVTRPLVQTCLLTSMCVVLWPNAQLALAHAHDRRKVVGQFERDLRAGLPASQIVERYHGRWPLLPYPKAESLAHLWQLNRAGAKAFRHLGTDQSPAPAERAVAAAHGEDAGRAVPR